MKKPQFSEDAIYHIYNRGVDHREIFLDKNDYLRFIHDLWEFNDTNPVLNVSYHFNPRTMEVEPQYFETIRKPREKLVDILLFTLMPNHYHLLLQQRMENGIVRFMQKLGTGYSMFFNQKYKRSGVLFQGGFKAVRVHTESHFLHLPFYIHTNPLERIYGGSTSINPTKAINFLEMYRWSSFPDYIGKKNFRSVISRNFLLSFFNGEQAYRRTTIELLKERRRERIADEIQDVALEIVPNLYQ